jgi:RimJ/RimL family protein N-acetyltransferase
MIAVESASLGTPRVGASVELRRASLHDRAALRAMYLTFEPKGAALGLPPIKDEALTRWLDTIADSPNFLLWVGDRVAGHAVICPDGHTAEVAIFVHQDFRGHGFGRLLLNALIAEARRRGLHRVWGIAEADNLPMLRLARSCGFRQGSEPGEFLLDL